MTVLPHGRMLRRRLLLVPRRAGGGFGGRRWRTKGWPADGSRLGDAGGEGSPALSASAASVVERQKESFGAPLPGAPNVGSRVPAKPSRFEHWGAHEDLPLPNHALNLAMISRLARRTRNTERHEIYTGLGHRCGVIPYSSVVVVDCLLG